MGDGGLRTNLGTPYYADDQATLLLGDAYEVLSGMPEGAVDCVVTSPPYYGLRDYRADGQYGMEESPAAYVETMRALFAQVRRVLAEGPVSRPGCAAIRAGNSDRGISAVNPKMPGIKIDESPERKVYKVTISRYEAGPVVAYVRADAETIDAYLSDLGKQVESKSVKVTDMGGETVIVPVLDIKEIRVVEDPSMTRDWKEA